jgi:hypothetical protein
VIVLPLFGTTEATTFTGDGTVALLAGELIVTPGPTDPAVTVTDFVELWLVLS